MTGVDRRVFGGDCTTERRLSTGGVGWGRIRPQFDLTRPHCPALISPLPSRRAPLPAQPPQMLETGHDILFFWVARMIMMGIEFTGR